MNSLVCALVIFAGYTSAWAADADNAALELLKQMHESARKLSYQGAFVYLHNGKMESMRVYRRVDEKGERERVVHLNGSPREVIRENNVVTCILPESKSVVVNKLAATPNILSAFPANAEVNLFKQHYHFLLAGQDRIAGRETKIVAVLPYDHFRYGYRFWFDINNGLLLKSQMLNETSEPIEQVMFTEIQESPNLPEALLKPSMPGGKFVTHDDRNDKLDAEATVSAEWQVGSMPQGFKPTEYAKHRLAPGAPFMHHLVLSDGLASVSVYIEKLDPNKKRFIGSSYMGSVNVYGAIIGDHQVTVVGEVPQATVKMVADSIQSMKQ